ncbi:hypothetical protein NLJ89_g7153 [Agrocybe chaxingu]|uniref:Mucoidy inhibitor A n=1 Tax=Agrocybe chaxingu TaxID=84603 RepID=A0A9W8JXC5_9AGAR|nr:hypothetical protein NLJ89_g7153 [Agrocybe chaxingu]
MTTDTPSLPTVNIVKLDAQKDGGISHVSLYFNRAEVTRVFQFIASAGANNLVVSKLPDVLESDTVRVEGRGSGTIHDVSIVRGPCPEAATSDLLTSLRIQEEDLQRAVARCRKCQSSIEHYASGLTTEHVNVAELVPALETYEAATKKYDDQLVDLQKSLGLVRAQLSDEENRLAENNNAWSDLRKIAHIGFQSETSGNVQLNLIYFVKVRAAVWNAKYDIRVSTESEGDNSVRVFYKAAVAQTTGETWSDVPLTLETASPSSSVTLPTISPWRLKLWKAPPAGPVERPSKRKRHSRFLDVEAEVSDTDDEECEEVSEEDEFCEDRRADLAYPSADVSSRGDLGMAFRLPGFVSIPSDGEIRTFTIKELELPSKLTRFAIPRVDTRTHMTAKIVNASEYTLLPGRTNVYVDGTFTSTMNMFVVSPDETFNCPLGLDQAIRIVYHPRESKASQSGFYTKASNTLISQRVTIHNTRLRSVPELNIIDQIPIAEDAQITVALKKPALVLPSQDSANLMAPFVRVEEGVSACWYDAGDSGNIAALGKEGKLKWVCSVPAQQKINLLLQWEVSVPSDTTVLGLE